MRTRATLGECQLLDCHVHKAMTRFDQHTVKNTFVLLLEVAHVQISMAAVGRPTENAYVERLMRALKEEKVYLHEYRDLEDARQHIGRFLDEVYMHKRVHSALGYLPPGEFEAQWYAQQGAPRDPELVR